MPQRSPRVVVKLVDDLAVTLPYQDDLVSAFPADLSDLWNDVLPGLTLDRALPAVDAAELRAKLQENERDDAGPAHNLLAYFAIEVPADGDAEELAAAALSLPIVESAHVESEVILAGVDVTDDPLVLGQGYLGVAPVGIDALHAWTKAGGDGAGVTLVDVEFGFLVNHEDLLAVDGSTRITVLPTGTPATDLEALEHSTNVLGIVMATDNDKGIVGITPGVEVYGAPVGTGAPLSTDLDNALIAIWLDPRFGPGTVVLIEHQDPFLRPVETDLFVRNTIREITRSGMTVIVPAGNGGHDLDTFVDGPHGYVFDRNIFDSGAVMVAGATVVSHEVHSCHGARIDCYAWGEGILTTSATTSPPGGLNGYTNGVTVTLFGGSSGASAIVAGAAVAVQGMHRQRHGYLLPPARLRALLSRTGLNTAPAPTAVGRIGVMPDLRRLAAEIGAV